MASKPYSQLLEEEMAAWRALEAVIREQRQAIIQRQAQRVEALGPTLRERLCDALRAHQQTQQARPQPPDPQWAAQEHAVDEAHMAAREALRFNLELLREVCAYLEMFCSAIAPTDVPGAYGRARRPRVAAATTRQVA